MPDYHNINVAKPGRNKRDGEVMFYHYFRVRLGQYSRSAAMEVAEDIQARFPECNITLTEWRETGLNIEVSRETKEKE